MAKTSQYLPPRPADASTVAAHFESVEMAKRYPAIYALLCTAQRDGKARKGARLTLFAEGGRLKIAVSDSDTEQTFWSTLEGSGDLLQEIETNIAEQRGEWRRQAANGYGGTGRRT